MMSLGLWRTLTLVYYYLISSFQISLAFILHRCVRDSHESFTIFLFVLVTFLLIVYLLVAANSLSSS